MSAGATTGGAAGGHAAERLTARLRRDTRGAHEAVEAAFDLPAWLASRDSYAALLRRLLSVHRAADAALEPFLAGTPLHPAGTRADLLLHDLASLGAPDAAATPIPGFAEVVRDRAAALGAVYVVEGSSLGGLVIARVVRERLGLGERDGAAFFTGDGRATAARWTSIREAIDRHAEGGNAADRTVEAAIASFRLVGAALTPGPVGDHSPTQP